MGRYIFAQERFYLQGILNDIVCLPKKLHGFTSRINSKGYHSLVPGLISIFRDSMGPFNMSTITIEA